MNLANKHSTEIILALDPPVRAQCVLLRRSASPLGRGHVDGGVVSVRVRRDALPAALAAPLAGPTQRVRAALCGRETRAAEGVQGPWGPDRPLTASSMCPSLFALQSHHFSFSSARSMFSKLNSRDPTLRQNVLSKIKPEGSESREPVQDWNQFTERNVDNMLRSAAPVTGGPVVRVSGGLCGAVRLGSAHPGPRPP